MDQAVSHLYDLSQPLHKQLRVTARIGLLVSVFATLALMLTLYLLFQGHQQGNYLHIIQSLTQSHDQLLTAMLVGGMLIVVMAGLMTWFILLYSSARIAGPLYRFRKNLEMEINEGPVPTVQLRKGDCLQDLSGKLSSTVDHLSARYAEQLQAVGKLQQLMESGEYENVERYQQLLNDLAQAVDVKTP